MLKPVLSFILASFFYCSLFSQLHDNIWHTGINGPFSVPGLSDNSIITFDSIPPIVTLQEDYHYLTNRQCGTVISDQDGHLLFSTNGHEVSNSENELMLSGDSLNFMHNPGGLYYGSGSTIFQGLIALPDPVQGHIFHLLHINSHFIGGFVKGTSLLYSKIDMSLDGGKGAIIEKNTIILEDTVLPGGLTATKHANGRDWWLIIFRYGEPNYYRVLLTPNGVINMGLESLDEGVIVNPEGSVNFSLDGEKLVVVSTEHDVWTNDQWLYVFDFDRCSGLLSNQHKIHYTKRIMPYYCTTAIYSGHGYGCSFSPNSRYLYLAGRWGMFQADLWSTDVEESIQVVAHYDGFQEPDGVGVAFEGFTTFGWSQLGPDGRIYCSTLYPSRRFHVTERPNNAGLGCRVVQRGLTLFGLNAYTVPNHANYRLGPLEGSGCDTLGVEKAVFIHAHPYPEEGCAGGEAHFEVTAFGSGKSHQWQVSQDGGGSWEDLSDGPHFTGAQSEYLVLNNIQLGFDEHQFRCVVAGSASTATSRPATLNVIDEMPVAAFDLQLDKDSLHVFNQSQQHEYSQWYFGDGNTSALPDASHMYLTTGPHEVSLVATNACGTDTAFQEVEIAPIFADFEADRTFGCAPLEVTFTSLSPYRVCPNEYIMDGAWVNYSIGKLREVTVTYDEPGVYDVEYRVYSPEGETDTIVLKDYITVLDGTNPDAGIAVQQNGATVELQALFDQGESYTWVFSTGDTLNGLTVEYTFATPGVYGVWLEASNHCGSATSMVEIIVGELTAGFSMNQQQGCAPLEVQFTNTTDLPGAEYEWYFQGGQPESSTEEHPIVVYENAGSFDVTLLANAGGLADTVVQTQAIEIFTNACSNASIFTLIDGLEVTVWTDCTAGNEYSWLMGDGSSFSTQGITYQYEEAGIFEIMLLIEGPCGLDTSFTSIELTDPVFSIETNQLYKITIIPNPAAAQATIVSGKKFNKGASISFYNTLGVQVLKIEKSLWRQQEQVDLSEFINGLYLYHFEDPEGLMQVGKLVVEK